MHNDVVGIDLGGTKVLLCCGEHEEHFSTGPRFSPQDLLQHLRAFLGRNGLAPARMGIAIPGLVGGGGRVTSCDVLPSFTGWMPKRELAALCRSVVVLNDVQAALLDEMHDAPAGHTGIVVMVGTAIGAAIIANGKPMQGASGWAGELGYLPIALRGQVQRLDDLAGGAGMAAACGISSAQLARRAAAADAVALQTISAGGHFLGLSLAAVINLLNPARVAVGGGTLELPGYWDAARATAAQHAIPALWADCTLDTVRSGAHAVVKGAIRAALG